MMKIGVLVALVAWVLAVSATGGNEPSMWSDPVPLTQLGNERVSRSDFREAVPLLETAVELAPVWEGGLASLANAFHLQRRLDEAADLYARLLHVAPPTAPSKQQEDAILRFSPRVFQTVTDPFPLKDALAIHHPHEPLIAYHFFWADDIDFPDDNDPCDHELVWVRYNPSTETITDLTTYFHGRLLHSAAAVEEAHQHGERPRVNVQWGKHGSLPFGWESLSIQPDAGDIEKSYLEPGKPMRLADYNRATYLKLHNEGRRLMDHPLSRAWPKRFDGSWDQFIDFRKEIDLRQVLKQSRAMAVSAWNNAVLQQRFLPYNFRPKTEWPNQPSGAAEGLELRRTTATSNDRLMELMTKSQPSPDDLPPAATFKPETPRYPNVWFYGAESEFPTYKAFIDALARRFQDDGYTADAVALNEGADLALSIEHLQPWTAVQRLSHSHAVHIRFFWKRLEQQERHVVKFGPSESRHWRVAASVHYEVEHANPLHADVEVCPICGRTGVYADREGNLVERVHDPLGLEILLWGTVRGEPVLNHSLAKAATEVIVIRPTREDMNTATIAFVKM